MGHAGAVVGALPTGTVTFLLTDIEDSSRLWTADDGNTASVVSRHYEIIDAAVARHDGARPVEQGEGDSAVAVFVTPSSAVAAALDAQRQITEELGDLKVRMGLHTGEAKLLDGTTYCGTEVIRCARLRDLGHGGQVLVSRTVRDLVLDHLPEGAELRDLGEHRLRGLDRPEHVFQLNGRDMSATFPPLRTAGSDSARLPLGLASFVGRTQELAAVEALLMRDRLVTLTGVGGCGKTRLALELAQRLDPPIDGVYYVDLAPISDPLLVAKTVCDALSIREAPSETPAETLVRVLAERRVLVLFDNCEHLIRACAALCEAVLRTCPGVVVLATSREPLGVEGETTYVVPSLTLPDSIDLADDAEAVQLFVDRARRARPTFELTPENTGAVASICARLDGMPLAIELAAARVRSLTPERIASGLDDTFRMLSGGVRTAVQRQQTMQASVDWSWDLLNEDQRTLFRRLAVFAGTFALESAESICHDDVLDEYEVFEVLTQLVERSLVQIDETASRYRLLETLRQYSAQRLIASGEADAFRLRHLDHFLALVEDAAPRIEIGATISTLQRLDLELDNLRTAVEWATASGRASAALRIVVASPAFWTSRGFLVEARDRIASLLPAVENDDALKAKALVALANIGFREGVGPDEPLRVGHLALDLARSTGDPALQARARLWIGWTETYVDAGNALKAKTVAAEAARDANDAWAATSAQISIAVSHVHLGAFSYAQEVLRDAVRSAREMSDLVNLQEALLYLGACSWARGQFARAYDELTESLDIAATVVRYYTPANKAFLGHVALARGGFDDARDLIQESILEAKAVGNGYYLGIGLQALAFLDAAVGAHRAAIDASMESAEVLVAGGVWVSASLALVAGGRAAVHAGDLDRARTLLAEASSYAAKDGAPAALALSHVAEATLARSQSELTASEEFARTAVRLGATESFATPEALEVLAGVLSELEEHEQSARILGAAHAWRVRSEHVRWLSDESQYRADVDRCRTALGTEHFDAAWTIGIAMTAEAVCEYVGRGRGTRRRRPPTGWDGLTPAELEVAKLIAEGLSNPQIGERMFISRRTVQSHLSRVYAKLGLTSRTELALAITQREHDRRR